MAFIFTMRSTPVNSHRRNASNATSLPAIDEDNASFLSNSTKPPVPPRALNRPQGHGRYLGPGFGSGSAQGWIDSDGSEGPPSYNTSDDGRNEKDRFAELRRGFEENKHISKRGGWRRLLLLFLILLVIGVALGVGLGVGLKKKNSNATNTASSGSSSISSSGGASGDAQTPPSTYDSPPNATFPEGSYTFNTYLSTVATNCTSNPSTWMCYPYQTYSQSRNSSATVFDWIIRPSTSSSKNYTISSTPNPFSIMFDSALLQLMKQGQEDEHYFFQLNMSKPTKPTSQLGQQNVAATCYFDNTTLQAYLYTKKQKTYPPNEAGERGSFKAWPGAVKVEQVTGAKMGSPRCVDMGGQSLGEFGVEDGTQLCDCLWLNTGT